MWGVVYCRVLCKINRGLCWNLPAARQLLHLLGRSRSSLSSSQHLSFTQGDNSLLRLLVSSLAVLCVYACTHTSEARLSCLGRFVRMHLRHLASSNPLHNSNKIPCLQPSPQRSVSTVHSNYRLEKRKRRLEPMPPACRVRYEVDNEGATSGWFPLLRVDRTISK